MLPAIMAFMLELCTEAADEHIRHLAVCCWVCVRPFHDAFRQSGWAGSLFEAAQADGAVPRLRKSWLDGCQFASIGAPADLTYPTAHLGEGAAALSDLQKANNAWGKKLREAKHPVVIVGPGILHRPDRGAILQKVCLRALRNPPDLPVSAAVRVADLLAASA